MRNAPITVVSQEMNPELELTFKQLAPAPAPAPLELHKELRLSLQCSGYMNYTHTEWLTMPKTHFNVTNGGDGGSSVTSQFSILGCCARMPPE